MSRIGKQIVTWKQGTKVSWKSGVLTVEAGKASLQQSIDPRIQVELDDEARTARFTRRDDSPESRSMHGLYRALAANMVRGVEDGFEKRLEIQGVGYRAEAAGKKLKLTLGFSHPVEMDVPEGLTVKVEDGIVSIEGASKHQVGQFASEVRKLRPPEPYKGKGVRYVDEYVRRKVGKAGAA